MDLMLQALCVGWVPAARFSMEVGGGGGLYYSVLKKNIITAKSSLNIGQRFLSLTFDCWSNLGKGEF